MTGKEYYAKNREIKKKRNREYYAKNREVEKKKSREYYAKNIEERRKKKNEYHVKNREAENKKAREYRLKIKEQAFGLCGRGCYCPKCEYHKNCPLGFITFDHSNDDGNIRRKNGEKAGDSLYRQIVKQGYVPHHLRPSCYNCNMGRRTDPDGLCPHEKEERELKLGTNSPIEVVEQKEKITCPTLNDTKSLNPNFYPSESKMTIYYPKKMQS